MSILDEAQRLSAAGRQDEAIERVKQAARKGDGEALHAVANWRLFGLNGPRDLKKAHRLLERAGKRGYVEATRLRATLIANGTGGASNPAKASALLSAIRDRDPYAALQLEFARRMRDEDEIAALPVETLSEAPLIRSIEKFLTHEECQYLINLAGPHLQPSSVVDPRTGARIPHPVRTSTGMSFGPTQEDLVVHKINRRLAQVTGTKVGWGEPLHILHYAPGQQYRPHMDSLPGESNQRHWTVLVYLNAGYAGGETRFEQTGLVYPGGEGSALIFRNVDEKGEPDPLTQHAGLPVTGGVKWLATRWIRQADYHPWA
ncbi:MAG: 2OG-Fe(II) oxygenase [Sphingomonadaceae bacterium]